MKKYFSIIKNIALDRVRRKTGKYYFIKAIKKTPFKIVIGASGVTPAGWTPSDADYLNLLNENHWSSYFKDNKIDALLAEHVWEHLSEEEGGVAAAVCFKYLKEGGYLRVAVPDGFFPDQKYIDYVRPAGSGYGADDHKILYTYKTLSDIFEKAGFRVDLLEYFDENGFFHYKEWNKDDGMIFRSKRFDERNVGEVLGYTSIILDAKK
jgi:predicted SAM-dependent methyltransferase